MTPRYVSAAAFLSDLRKAAAGERIGEVPDSVAVVDFVNLSQDTDDDWIGTGIAESLTTDLSRLAGLELVNRGKIRKATAELGSAEPVPLGNGLGCRWLLSGAFQKMGPMIRVTATLTDVAAGSVGMTHKLDGRVDEIFSLQDQLSAAVAAHFEVHRLSPVRDEAPRLSPD